MSKNMHLVSVDENFDEAVEIAAQAFFNDEIFIYPTDTIYGFGGNPFTAASEKIIKIKGRGEEKKFILLTPDLNTIIKLTENYSALYWKFLQEIWPNPISVVIKLNEETGKQLSSQTAAFRIPDHKFCRRVLETINTPLISTSVNRSGNSPLNDFERMIEEFKTEVGVLFYEKKYLQSTASTIIDITGPEPVLIREGVVKFTEIMKKFNNIFDPGK